MARRRKRKAKKRAARVEPGAKRSSAKTRAKTDAAKGSGSGSGSPRDSGGAPTPKKPPRDWAEVGRAYGVLFGGAVAMFLGFAGFGVWPLAFVGMVPAMIVLDADPPRGFARADGRAFFLRAGFFGYIAYYGGFHWIADTIHVFGEFPYVLSALFASAFFLFQGGQFVLALWLFRRARDRGYPGALAIVPAFVGAEIVFPHLFDHFYGNSLHAVAPLVQIADLGGPTLVTALLMLGNAAAYALTRGWLRRERIDRRAPIVFVAALLTCLAYGYYRIGEVEARMADAEHLEVGVVQVDMGIFDRHEQPGESTRRHLEQSLQLESEGPLDLIVWPESSLDFAMSRDPDQPVAPTLRYGLEQRFRREYPGFPEAPVLLGASSRVELEGRVTPRNTSFLVGADGTVDGLYDKTYLLMFGEYLPFGERFPILYEWSPNTGRFVPGDDPSPVVLDGHAITVLVCYEDIIPRFTRDAIREGQPELVPELIVNQTNDAWFVGQEPYVHLALAKMRAVEHHRALVRATLTGVSAVIDPAGRVMAETERDTRQNLRVSVPLMDEATIYETVGDWPGWASLAAILFLAFVGRRRREEERPAADDDEDAPRRHRERKDRDDDDDE